jgi:hypothetical protein
MNEPAQHAVTLDGLFRRAGVRNAHAPALADPPNRANVTDGAPRTLTYAQADRAIAAFAAKLRGLGLHTGTVVGVQLPNTVESVIAFLGIVCAGMVAAPLPLLLRRQELVEALGRAGARAIVTAGRIGACAHAKLAMVVAAELFPIRQVCAFGDTLPDGVVPFDGVFTATGSEPPPRRTGDSAEHVIATTFDCAADGSLAVPHDHTHLLAAGASLGLATGFAADMPTLSTIPLSSFAGLTVTLVSWLMTGGTLHLHHGFDAEAFAAQSAALKGGAVILPGPALSALADCVAQSNTIVALWRAPLGAAAQTSVANVVDCVCLDETTMTSVARGTDGLPDPAVIAAAGKIVAPGLIGVGAYKFRQRMIDAAVAAVEPAAMIAALPDALLGQRLAGHAQEGAAIGAELAARGANPLLAQAFRTRALPV